MFVICSQLFEKVLRLIRRMQLDRSRENQGNLDTEGEVEEQMLFAEQIKTT